MTDEVKVEEVVETPTEPAAEAPKEDAAEETTESQPATEEKVETEEAKDDFKEDVFVKKANSKLTARIHKLAQEKLDLLKELEEAKSGKVSEGVSEQLKEQAKAEAKKEIQAEIEVQEFNDTCNEVFAKGEKEIPNFKAKCAALGQAGYFGDNESGVSLLLKQVVEFDNAHKIIDYIASDEARADRLASLSPVKLAVELAKIETALSAPPQKKVSNAPAPVKPLSNAKAKVEEDITDYKAGSGKIADWVAMRNKADAERWKNRYNAIKAE